MSSLTISTLLSKIKTDRELTNIHSTNIAQAEVNGYTRKEAQTLSLASDGRLTGVKESEIYRAIDTVLQLETRRQNSLSGESNVRNDYMQRVGLLFGNLGEESSFAHALGSFAGGMAEVSGNVSISKKNEVVYLGQKFAENLSTVANDVSRYRGDIDEDLASTVTQINKLISDIAESNKQISQMMGRGTNTTNLEDNRDLLIHHLTELIGIKVYEGVDKKQYIYTNSGRALVQEFESYPLTCSASNVVVPGQVLSPVTQGGVDITAELTGGKISGLINLRDTFLPGIQDELDELARNVRDSINALHNEGTAIDGPTTLTGNTTVPGLGTTLAGTTVISGAGTVRIGVVDSNGTLLDYKDVALTENMTVAGLLAAVTGAPYTTNDVNGDFTLAQLPTGELQLTSTAGYSVTIGASGPAKPMINLGAAYDANTALGFSHFFGMNDLFVTPGFLASNVPQVGIANIFDLRPDIIHNQRFMAIGRLSNQVAPPPTNPGQALGIAQTDIALEIANQLKGGNLQFSAVGSLTASMTNVIEYSERIISTAQLEINTVNAQATVNKNIYDELALRANDVSGVEPVNELMEIYTLSASQQVTSQALSIVLDTMKELYNTIGRV